MNQATMEFQDAKLARLTARLEELKKMEKQDDPFEIKRLDHAVQKCKVRVERLKKVVEEKK